MENKWRSIQFVIIVDIIMIYTINPLYTIITLAINQALHNVHYILLYRNKWYIKKNVIYFGMIFAFAIIIMSMDNLNHSYIPIYSVWYHLSIIIIIGPTPTTTVVSTVLVTPSVTSSPVDRPSSGKSYILMCVCPTSVQY